MKRFIIATALLAWTSAASAQPAPPVPPAPPAPPVPGTPHDVPKPPKPPKPPRPPHGDFSGYTEMATATQSVTGVVTVRVKTMSGDVAVVAGAKGQIKVTITDASASKVAVVAAGPGRYEVQFDGRKTLRAGDVRLEVPRGTHVEAISLAGEMAVKGVGGNVKLKTTSGDISVDDVATAIVMSISGEVRAHEVHGDLAAKTVSGGADLVYVGGQAAKVRFESTSGDLSWTGLCGAGCKLDVETLSGDIDLRMQPKSSFALTFESRSGELDNPLGATIDKKPSGKPAHGPGQAYKTDDDDDFDDDGDFDFDETKVTGRYGKGEGVVTCTSFSGDLTLRKP